MLFQQFLPIIFASLMGLAILIYVILDGYDLGIGILMHNKTRKERDIMISTISPFWDANETWLVLAVGILLVAFPVAHGQVLGELYLPTALMLLGLIMRGVAFDFRTKAKDNHQNLWDKIFVFGSALTAFTQGYMLGLYIMGFEKNLLNIIFAIAVGFCLMISYSFIGACWLILKTENEIQKKSIKSARIALWFVVLGMILISVATPLVDNKIFQKWFSLPDFLFLVPIPILSAVIILFLNHFLKNQQNIIEKKCWLPFLLAVLIFVFGFVGIAYSFYPFIIPNQITIWDAASSISSLKIIFIATIIVLPIILAYTIFVHKIFWGKARELSY